MEKKEEVFEKLHMHLEFRFPRQTTYAFMQLIDLSIATHYRCFDLFNSIEMEPLENQLYRSKSTGPCRACIRQWIQIQASERASYWS